MECTSDGGASYVDFCGGWGSASFSLETLMYRANRGLAKFSDNITQYTSIKFVSIVIWGVPEPDLDWVLTGTTHFSNAKVELGNYKRYAQPLTMMLEPNRLFVPSYKRSNKRLFYKKKFYAGTQFTNELYDKYFFYNKPFFTYNWSNIDLELPVGVPQNDDFYTRLLGNSVYKNTWFKKKSENWLDRQEYTKPPQSLSDASVFSSWSAFFATVWESFKKNMFGTDVKQAPMQPPVLLAPKLQQASFFYNIKLQAAGRSIAGLHGGKASEIPKPECPCKSTNTQCSAHLDPDEVGSTGTISSETFRRIVGTDNQDELSFTNISSSGESSSEEEEEQIDETKYPLVRSLYELLKKRD